MSKIKQEKIEEISIDYGIVYTNYGEVDAKLLGPTRGGGTFDAVKEIRDIEFDGRNGKSAEMQVVDAIDAMLKVTVIETSIDTLELAMPYVTKTEEPASSGNFVLECDENSMGYIAATKYLKNVTMFAKLISGEYKVITIYNAMNESDVSFAAVQKGEAEIAFEFNAHWAVNEDNAALVDKLFRIEDLATIA